jgi:hypothetical protein
MFLYIHSSLKKFVPPLLLLEISVRPFTVHAKELKGTLEFFGDEIREWKTGLTDS